MKSKSKSKATMVVVAASAVVLLGGLLSGGLWFAMRPTTDAAVLAEAQIESSVENKAALTPGADAPRTKGVAAERYPRLPGSSFEIPAWVLKDAPFAPAELVNPLRWEDNAAPLYLEALCEFTSEVADCFPTERVAELRQLGQSRQKSHNDLLSKWNHDLSRLRKEKTAADNEAIDRVLAAFEPGFAKLAAAQAKKQCFFEPGLGVSTLLPHVQGSRSVVRVFGLRVERALDRKDFNTALDSAEAMLRLGRDVQRRGPMVSQLVSIAIENLTLKSIESILNASGVTTAHCNRLMEVLKRHEHERSEPWSMALPSEYAMARIAIQQVQDRSGDFAPESIRAILVGSGTSAPGSTPGHLLAFQFSFASGGNVSLRQVETINQRLELMSAADYENEVAALADWYRSAATLRKLPYAAMKTAVDRITTQHKSALFVSLVAAPNMRTMDAFVSNDVLLHGTQCMVALKRWQLENNAAPLDLALVLKRSGIDKVPTDPFSGQPFKLGAAMGKPLIYAFGKDGTDDRGQLATDGSYQGPGDIIFQPR